MKVLYIVHDMFVGGVSTIVNNLMQGMKERGHEVHIIILKRAKVDVLCDNIYCMDILNKLDYFNTLLKLKKIIEDIKPDVIHSHTVLCHLMVLFLKKILMMDIKLICTEHSSLTLVQSKKVIYRFLRYFLTGANLITFVSNYSLQSYLNFGILSSISNAVVVYNGIGYKDANLLNVSLIKEKLSINTNETIFCFVGRLSPEKNLEMMFKAMSILCTKNVRLLVVGDGDPAYRKKLLDMAISLKLSNINFMGHRDDIVDIINASDCLLLSSIIEGLPTVVIEAFSQRKNVISTICGGVEEIIKDNNFLAKSNDVFDFVDKINIYLNLNDQQKIEKTIKNYQIYIEKFQVSTMVSNYSQLYKSISDV